LKPPRIELITIGDELLLGFTVDTNAAHISRILAERGIEVARRTTVGDDADQIADAVGRALERTGAVITTGGLGPTADDLTKPAIARVFDRQIRLDPAIAAELEKRWRARFPTSEYPPSNRAQAEIPAGAKILSNRHGSAPGIWLEDDRGRWVAMLPGVPREMRGMLADELLPAIEARMPNHDASPIVSRTLRTTGIAESAIADLLGKDFLGAPDSELGRLPIAYLPGVTGVDLRVTVRGTARVTAEQLVGEAMARLKSVLGRHAYGEDDADLAAVVLDKCRRRGLTLAVAESCTGGMLGERITSVAGSSDVFIGGVIAYHNDAKRELLGVRQGDLEAFGAVSEKVALQMALGVRERLGSDIGVAITGVAGPGGGSAEKPVGLVWIGVDGSERLARRIHASGDRGEIRQRAAQAALEVVRRMLETG
jgi:nicotinamide-nucleotide amidase